VSQTEQMTDQEVLNQLAGGNPDKLKVLQGFLVPSDFGSA
jgi:hypothetical protein